MKFNDQKEVEIKSTKKKEEKSEEKKKLAVGDVKDALVGGVKGFYTVKKNPSHNRRIVSGLYIRNDQCELSTGEAVWRKRLQFF